MACDNEARGLGLAFSSEPGTRVVQANTFDLRESKTETRGKGSTAIVGQTRRILRQSGGYITMKRRLSVPAEHDRGRAAG